MPVAIIRLNYITPTLERTWRGLTQSSVITAIPPSDTLSPSGWLIAPTCPSVLCHCLCANSTNSTPLGSDCKTPPVSSTDEPVHDQVNYRNCRIVRVCCAQGLDSNISQMPGGSLPLIRDEVKRTTHQQGFLMIQKSSRHHISKVTMERPVLPPGRRTLTSRAHSSFIITLSASIAFLQIN